MLKIHQGCLGDSLRNLIFRNSRKQIYETYMGFFLLDDNGSLQKGAMSYCKDLVLSYSLDNSLLHARNEKKLVFLLGFRHSSKIEMVDCLEGIRSLIAKFESKFGFKNLTTDIQLVGCTNSTGVAIMCHPSPEWIRNRIFFHIFLNLFRVGLGYTGEDISSYNFKLTKYYEKYLVGRNGNLANKAHDSYTHTLEFLKFYNKYKEYLVFKKDFRSSLDLQGGFDKQCIESYASSNYIRSNVLNMFKNKGQLFPVIPTYYRLGIDHKNLYEPIDKFLKNKKINPSKELAKA